MKEISVVHRVATVLFAVLWIFSVEAAPVDPPRPEVRDEPKPSTIHLDSLQPTEVEGPQTVPQEELILPTRRITKKAVVATLGYWSGAFADYDVQNSIFGGLSQTIYDTENRAYDFGLELLQNGFFGLQAGRKWILKTYRWSEPHVRLGAGSFWKPAEGLGTITNVYRYQLRASFGFEDLAESKRQWRAELLTAWGLSGFSVGFATAFGF